MAAGNWKKERAQARIATRLKEVETIEVREYKRDTNLDDLPRNKAYRVDGVHLYVDILNLDEMLMSSQSEGPTCHRRTLRFLNLHQRAVHRILGAVDAIKVDFHNQRLHAVFAKPYDDEAVRVNRAVATAQLIVDVLAGTGEDGDEYIPAAEVRVGIDTGIALAVCNGRRGSAEPLFLGVPANHAAKRAGGGDATGIFLTNEARSAIGLTEVKDEDASALGNEDVAECEREAALSITAETVLRDWKTDLENNPIARFEFSGHTPPFADLDLELLTPGNSRRNDAVSIYADIDGFTRYVAQHIDTDTGARGVVRALHVLRSELDAVLTQDFGGRKIRFIGDCVHGVIAAGTAQTTDTEASAANAILCTGALRSSFNVALADLKSAGIPTDGLGLAIGFDAGPVAITRLGMKGAMIRCATGRCVVQSEAEQLDCTGRQTAIGESAYSWASEAARAIFGSDRKRADLDFACASAELSRKDESSSKSSRAAATGIAGAGLLEKATPAPTAFQFPNHNAAPTKPAGFA